uniref:Reverse transcriptase domain-containing protein n=1 Tax=Rhodnius prolixus TaxID=13249 RepID=T1HBA1_RHOPR
MALLLLKTWQICAYADDLVIVAKSEAALKEVGEIIINSGTKVGLVINENKTKYLKMSSAEHRRSVKDIEIMNFRFDERIVTVMHCKHILYVNLL